MNSTFWNITNLQSCQLSEFLERSLHPICVYDEQGQTVYVSQSFLESLQTSAIPAGFFDGFPPAMFAELLEFWDRAVHGESVQFLAQMGNCTDRIECSLQFDAGAKLMFSTIRKMVEPAERHPLTQAYESAILEAAHSNLATLLINSNGDVIQCNQHLHRLLGTRDREHINLEHFVHPADRLTDEQLKQNLLNGTLNTYTIEKRFISRDNSILWLNLNVSAIHLSRDLNGHHRYFAVILEDVTENKKIYSTLVRTEEKWKTLFSNTPYLFIQTSNSGQITYVSPAVEALLGYQQEELLGRQIKELIHPSQVNEMDLALQMWSSNVQRHPASLECWWRAKTNRWVALSMQGQRFPATLEIDGVMISGHNITDRKCLEVELRANEERFRSLVLNSLGTVFRCDSSYMMHCISDRIQTITGYPASVFVHNQVRSYLSIVHPDDVTILKDSLMQMILDRYADSIEYRIIDATGQIRWVEERKQGFFDPTGQLLWLDGLLLEVNPCKPGEA
jgi:PAS domain S-box-containing protein